MTRVHRGTMMRVGLTPLFLRAAPLKASIAIAALVSFVLVVVTFSVQSLQQSGGQLADELVGSADYLAQTGTSILIGQSGDSLDEAVSTALQQSASTKPRIVYVNLSGFTIDSLPTTKTRYEETDWRSNPFPKRLKLNGGRWPNGPGETAVSETLAQAFPIGSEFRMFGGAFSSTVVGTVTDDSARELKTVFAGAGSWNRMSEVGVASATRYAQAVDRNVLWNGNNDQAALAAIASVLGKAQPTVTADFLRSQMFSREDMSRRGPSSLIELSIATVVAPFVASLVSSTFAFKFTNRIRAILMSVGIPRRRSRAATISAVGITLLIGGLFGIAVGAAVGGLLRPIFDQFNNRMLGPIHGIVGSGGLILSALLVGALVATLLNNDRPKLTRDRQSVERSISPQKLVLAAASVILAVVGVLVTQGAASTDERILGGLSLSMAGAVLVPLFFDLLLIGEPRHMAALLAVRRLRKYSRQTALVTVSVSFLVILSFGVTTFLYSAVVTVNDQTESFVPQGQIQFAPEGQTSQLEADRIARQIENKLTLGSPVVTFIGDGGVDLLQGPTLIVQSIADLEQITNSVLSTDQVAVLESRGTLRTKPSDLKEVLFETRSGGKVRLSTLSISGIDPSFRNYDGFMLASAAGSLGIPAISRTLVYVNATSEQLRDARSAAVALDFNSDWLVFYKPPDVMGEPLSARLASAAIAGMAVAIMAFYASSVARTLRPRLRELRAVGIKQNWLDAVLIIQACSVLLVSFVGAAAAAVVGSFVMIRLSKIDLLLSIPWQSIGITFLVLVTGTTGAILFGRIKLTADRTESHFQ